MFWVVIQGEKKWKKVNKVHYTLNGGHDMLGSEGVLVWFQANTLVCRHSGVQFGRTSVYQTGREQKSNGVGTTCC